MGLMEALNRLGAIAVPGVTSYPLDETPDMLSVTRGSRAGDRTSGAAAGRAWRRRLRGGFGRLAARVAHVAGRAVAGNRLAGGAAGDGGGDRRTSWR